MFCPNCGAALPEGSKFCTACGQRVQIPAQTPTQTSQAQTPPLQYAPPAQQAPVYAPPAQQYAAPVQQFIPQPPQTPAEPPKKKKKLWLWIGLAAVLLIGVGLGLFFLLRGGKTDGEGKYAMKRAVRYKADGTVAQQYEYFLDSKGNPTGGESRDGDGKLLEVVEAVSDSKGNLTELKYFDVNEAGEKELDSWNQTDYDANGNILEEREYNENGGLEDYTTYAYDANDNLLEERYYNEYGSLESRETYTYDREDRETEHCSYDESGSLLWRIVTVYDEQGSMLSKTKYRDGGELDYVYSYENEYDAENRLIKAAVSLALDGDDLQPNGYVTYSYNADGKRILENHFSTEGDLSWKQSYDADGHELEYASYKRDGTENWKEQFEYDSHGNVIKVSDYEDGVLKNWIEYEYQYFKP